MTALDRRQKIIDRLVVLLENLVITLPSGAAYKGFVHNREALPAGKVPGMILLDADDIDNPRAMPALPPGRRAVQMRDQLVNMTPEIYFVLDVRKPNNDMVGEDLNAARLRILGAIWNDQTLWSIVGDNGNIKFDGAVTDLARNRTMQGQLGISITFTYPLKPSEIIG